MFSSDKAHSASGSQSWPLNSDVQLIKQGASRGLDVGLSTSGVF